MADLKNQIQSTYPINPDNMVIGESQIGGYVWGEGIPTITSFYTSSTEPFTTEGSYQYSVYSKPLTEESAPEFSIAFGDKKGRGSVNYSQWGGAKTNPYTPTYTIYHQIKNQIGVGDRGFLFGDTYSDYFYVINVNRSGYKERLSTENMTLTLSKIDYSTPPFEVKRILHLTNDSAYNTPIEMEGIGNIHQMILGENGVMDKTYDQRGWSESEGSYGWFIPQMGIILLNGKALDEDYIDGGLLLGTDLSFNFESRNMDKLFHIIEEGGNWEEIPNPNTHRGFTLASTETLKEKYVFVDIPAGSLNYSNNPTFTSGSTGDLQHEDFAGDPQVYITSVGFYNSNEELVATAKLSQPLLKDFAKHLMLRTKLDF